MTNDKGKKTPLLKCMVFIVDWTRARDVTDIFEQEKIRFHFIVKARGTANSDILDLLGIGSAEKAVVMGLEQDIGIPALLRESSVKLGLHNPGAGIAFVLPLSGINQPILQVFKESIEKNYTISLETEAEKMNVETKFDLIISVVNQGYSDEFMTLAREAGASGGTVVNARGMAHQGPVKFFGISVQDEKEIIAILSTRERKAPIMQAVSQAFGISSQAEGIIFSLPVDSVAGLNIK
jgi:nitrogen regulatory protein PII